MNKQFILFDKNDLKELHQIKGTGVVEVRNKTTGEVVFKKRNKIILPGSNYTAALHFDIPIVHNTPTYNEVLNLENSIDQNLDQDIIRKQKICLFSVGMDGCGPDQHQVYDVNYGMWCRPKDLVPFRVVSVDNDLPRAQRDKYYGRVKGYNDSKYIYYFKGFDAVPTFNQRYVSDGTLITKEVYNLNRSDEIVSYIELKMSVDKEDVLEHFALTLGKNHTKINTISLLLANPISIAGINYYQDIRPITKINFPNEPLVDIDKGLDITYQIYY